MNFDIWYLYFLFACCAIYPHVAADDYNWRPCPPKVVPHVYMPRITRDDIETAFAEAKEKVQEKKFQERELSGEGRTVNRNVKSVESVFHNTETTLPETPKLADKQAPFEKASDYLIRKYNLNADQVAYGLPRLSLNSPNAAAARKACRSGDDIECDDDFPYRTIDGTCNNLKNPKWGSSMSCFQRHLPAVYVGEFGFRKSKDGGPLPEPRILSLNVHRHKNRPTHYVNHLYMFFGQLLDHDFAQTAVTTIADNQLSKCCPVRPDNHPQCAPIIIPRNDYFYSKFGITCLNFIRSAICKYCTLGPRKQLNQLSAFIDASFVYSNRQEVTDSLRKNDGSGMLRVQKTPVGDLLPPSKIPGKDGCSIPEENKICFSAGDPRVNQQPPLTSLHTVFVRQHNRIARELGKYNPWWGEERRFQESRKIIGALMQMMVYNEYLPSTLGNERMSQFKLWLSNKPTTYDPCVDPTLYTEFTTAAFRFGHTYIDSFIAESPSHGNHSGHMLRDVFFKPFGLYQKEVEMTLKGCAISSGQKFDRHMVPDVTNFLYRVRGSDTGFDLAAANIQRGRDHGLAGYTAYVRFCSQIEVRNFDDLVEYNLMTPETMKVLRSYYSHVKDIDLFTGGISEIYEDEAAVGPTFACLIGRQFNKLKHGDRFYFEHRGVFTPAQLREIKKMTFAKFLCKTTGIAEIPKYALLLPSSSNPIVSCEQMPSMDLRAWQE